MTENTNVLAEIQSMQAQIETGKAEKIRAETNLTNLNQQLTEKRARLAELGVAEENLETEIVKRDTAITELIAQAKVLLAPPAPPVQSVNVAAATVQTIQTAQPATQNTLPGVG